MNRTYNLLGIGLAMEDGGVTNPYKFGMVGASDTHTGATSDDASNFFAKVGLLDSLPELRGSVPLSTPELMVARFIQPKALKEIDGEEYFKSATSSWCASGLAAVWAEENTRDAIYDAVRRKETFEKVYDVACSDGARPDAKTHRCPDNGARVDLQDCSISQDVGAAELKAQWRDPDFNPDHKALYYVRALENSTYRWSIRDALRAGTKPRADLKKTIQERAWSSPIWYVPQTLAPTATAAGPAPDAGQPET